MTDVTRILSASEQGDAGAADQLLPLVCLIPTVWVMQARSRFRIAW
jgi:hypothetical protein